MEEPIPASLTVEEAQTLCLANHIPFYSYRLPGASEVVFGAQLSDEFTLFPGFEKQPKATGFLLTPFNPASWSFPYFIRGDVLFTDRLTDPEAIARLRETRFRAEHAYTEEWDMTQEVYIDKIRKLLPMMQREHIQKVVISRTITLPGDVFAVAAKLFRQLMEYTQAFVFLVSIPGKSTWAGASPSAFLQYDRDGFSSTALGGTLPVQGTPVPVVWPDKEIAEQQIVADYVESILTPFFTRDLHRELPETIRAGNVYHLASHFRSDEQLPADVIDELIRQLHPTPAVCGLPKKRAMQLIAETETEERGYYAGLLGPVQLSGAFNLFINLRSMELFRNGGKLHVGGGITLASQPGQEWQETTEKADTLLAHLRQIIK